MDPKKLNSYVGVVNQPPPKWSSVKKWLLHINYAPGYAPEPEQKPVCRQFSRCEGCPYPAHGFLCWGGEDDCMRTRVKKLNEKELEHEDQSGFVKRHPEITLTLLLPYHPHDQFIPVPEGFDGTFYPPGMETVPKRAAIVRANRYMLEHSSYLIAYVSHPSSGSREVLEAALRRQKHGLIHVTNLAGWYPI